MKIFEKHAFLFIQLICLLELHDYWTLKQHCNLKFLFELFCGPEKGHLDECSASECASKCQAMLILAIFAD